MGLEKPTAKRVTLRDVADQLGVSYATVSRALNGVEDAYISDATRARVREMAQQMGYRPNHAGRSLSSGRTGLLALWLYPMHGQTAYHAAVARRMGEAADARGYPMVVDPIRPGGERRPFDRWQVDGVILHEAAPALANEVRPPVPLVATGAFQLLEGVDEVKIDLRDGAQHAMAHLLQTGRRKIVYLTDDLATRSADIRYQVYTNTLDAAGFEPRYMNVEPTRAGAREGVKAYVAEHGVPEAFFCHNDDYALGTYRGLCDLGVKVPDDVALVGCDGIQDLEYLEVPITTIAQPLDEMCDVAFHLLETRIADPTLPIRRERLNARLVIRASTGE